MTRAEFIHQAIISMAGRVVGTDGTTEARDWEHVVNEAEELADTVERESAALFDSEGDTPLERIADAVEAIRNAVAGYDDDSDTNIRQTLDDIRRMMNNPDDKPTSLSALQELAKSLWDIEGHQRHLAALEEMKEEEER